MKKSLIVIIFYLLACVNVEGQDASLYQGPSDIYNRSGTLIKQVQLWQIDSVRVTFVKSGNLSDILTTDVLRIVTKGYEMSFDEQNQVVIKMYDCIILFSGDTLRGFIVNVLNERYLEYMPVNGKRIKETGYKSYVTSSHIQEGKNKNFTTGQTAVSDTNIQKQVNVVNAKQGETKYIIYPSAKNNKKNKDVIITNRGDTILCKILKNNPESIKYSILRIGHDKQVIINKKDVKSYNDMKEPKSGWKVPVTIVAIIAAILTIQILAVSAANY